MATPQRTYTSDDAAWQKLGELAEKQGKPVTELAKDAVAAWYGSGARQGSADEYRVRVSLGAAKVAEATGQDSFVAAYERHWRRHFDGPILYPELL